MTYWLAVPLFFLLYYVVYTHSKRRLVQTLRKRYIKPLYDKVISNPDLNSEVKLEAYSWYVDSINPRRVSRLQLFFIYLVIHDACVSKESQLLSGKDIEKPAKTKSQEILSDSIVRELFVRHFFLAFMCAPFFNGFLASISITLFILNKPFLDSSADEEKAGEEVGSQIDCLLSRSFNKPSANNDFHHAA
jgi:hypothetical protein